MSTVGNITVYEDYKDQITSVALNQTFLNRFALGIYYGGDLTIASNTSVNLSAFDIQIWDGTYTIKSTSSGTNTITCSTTNVWIVARWSYTGVNGDVPTLLAVSSPLAYDIIFGQCVYSGSTLQGFNLSSRNDAANFQKYLMVEGTNPLGKSFKVRAGTCIIGTQVVPITEQIISYPYTMPVSNPRIDLVVILTSTVGGYTSGQIYVIQGTENVSPSIPFTSGHIPLAYITLTSATTTIGGTPSSTNAPITDARPFLSEGSFVDLVNNQTIAGTKTFTGGLVIPAVTSDPVSPVNGQLWLRTDY